MNTNRPSYNIELLTLAGVLLNCTIKTPTLARVRAVRRLAVQVQFVIEQRSSTYNKSNALNKAIAEAELDMLAARRDAITNPRSQELAIAAEKELGDARAALAMLQDQMDAKEDEEFGLLVDQLKTIVNLPNDKSTDAPERARSLDEIDWDSVDRDELTGAVSFFLTGKTT